MTNRDIFEQAPDFFFSHLKRQMLRGLLLSNTVDEALAPLLEDYDALVAQLPLSSRADIERILKVHPEIAARYDIDIPPSVVRAVESLREDIEDAARTGHTSATRHFHPSPSIIGATQLSPSFLNETQAPYGRTSLPAKKGRSIMRSDKGAWMILVMRWEQDEARVHFQMPGLASRVSVRFSGRPALDLAPEQGGRGEMNLFRLLEIFRNIESSGGFPTLELIEETGA
jgi:hypothetical protein